MRREWIKSRHEYRATQQGRRQRFQTCSYHLRQYEAWGKTALGHLGPKQCPECVADARFWAMAVEQLGAPANEDKRAVYELAKRLAGIPLYRYLQHAR